MAEVPGTQLAGTRVPKVTLDTRPDAFFKINFALLKRANRGDALGTAQAQFEPTELEQLHVFNRLIIGF